MNTKPLLKKPSTPVEPARPVDDEGMTVCLDHFEKDVICTKCGLWKTEHRWEICRVPNWLV